jgi:hypothetical protein
MLHDKVTQGSSTKCAHETIYGIFNASQKDENFHPSTIRKINQKNG